MSREDVKKFYDLVEKDMSLAKELEDLNEKIKVNQTDFNKLRSLVEKEIIPIAKRKNLDFNAEELLTYANDKYMQLTEEDLMDISGGVSARNSAIGLSAVLLLSLGSTAAINLLTPKNNLNQSISHSRPMNVDNNKEDKNKENKKENENDRKETPKSAKNEVETLKNKKVALPNAEKNNVSKMSRVQNDNNSNGQNQVHMDMQERAQGQGKNFKEVLEEILRVQKEKTAGANKEGTRRELNREKQNQQIKSSNEAVEKKEEVKAQSNVGEQETRWEFYRDVHAQGQNAQDSQNAQNVQSAQDANKEVAQSEDTKKETPKVDKKLEKINAKNAVNDAKEKIEKNIIRIYNDAKKENGGILDEAGIAKLIQRSDIADNIPFKENILIQVDLGEKNSTVEIKYNNKELGITEKSAVDVGKILRDENQRQADQAKKDAEFQKKTEEQKAENAVSALNAEVRKAIEKMYNEAKQAKGDILDEDDIAKLLKRVDIADGIVYDGNIEISVENGLVKIKYNNEELNVTKENEMNVDIVLHVLNEDAKEGKKEQEKKDAAIKKQQEKEAKQKAEAQRKAEKEDQKKAELAAKEAENDRINKARAAAEERAGVIEEGIQKMYQNAVANNDNKPLNVGDFLNNVDLKEFLEGLPEDKTDFEYEYNYDDNCVIIKVQGLDVTCKAKVKELVNVLNNNAKQNYRQAEKEKVKQAVSDAKAKISGTIENIYNETLKADGYILNKADMACAVSGDIVENIECDKNIVISRNGNKLLIEYKNEDSKVVAKDSIDIMKTMNNLNKTVETEKLSYNGVQSNLKYRITAFNDLLKFLKQERIGITVNSDEKAIKEAIQKNVKKADLKKLITDIREVNGYLKQDDAKKYFIDRFGYGRSSVDSEEDALLIRNVAEAYKEIGYSSVTSMFSSKMTEFNNLLKFLNEDMGMKAKTENQSPEDYKELIKEQIRNHVKENNVDQLIEDVQKISGYVEQNTNQSFIKDREVDHKGANLIKAIAKAYKKLGYESVQGVLTSRPVAFDKLSKFLQNDVEITINDSAKDINEKIKDNVKEADRKQLMDDVKDLSSHLNKKDKNEYVIEQVVGKATVDSNAAKLVDRVAKALE